MRPTLLFDGDLRLNRARAAQWHYLTGNEVNYVVCDDAWGMFPDTFGKPPAPAPGVSFHLVDHDGEVYTRGEAVARVMAHAHHGGWRLWLYKHAKPYARLTDWWYETSAKRPVLFERLHTIFSGRDDEPSSYFFTRWMFIRLIGLVYVIAFASLWWQLSGLAGSDGIMPAAEIADSINSNLDASGAPEGWQRILKFPSVFAFAANDTVLHGTALAGFVASVLFMVGILPPLTALVAWACYLSFFSVLPVFLGYQWDVLLLEAGFLAIFFAPWQLTPGPFKRTVPSVGVLWLLRWLAFRLTFMSGYVKLGGPTWENLTALNYHFETQPLPNLLGWYLHHLPEPMLKGGVLFMFFAELIVPFTIFMPRRPRAIGAFIMMLLQVTIFLSGNYGFFNILSLALYVTLLDDGQLKRLLSSATVSRIGPPPFHPKRPLLKPVVTFVLMLVIVPASLTAMATRVPIPVPETFARVYQAVQPFYLASGYGLFARMTTTRPELIVEGSDNGQDWQPYVFKYKAGPIERRPPWVQPHMPRLDWQMWFEALNAERGGPPQPWFQRFLVGLLENREPVVAMLAENPFEGAAPNYIRVRIENYTFTTLEHRRETGEWWAAEPRATYVPPISLR